MSPIGSSPLGRWTTRWAERVDPVPVAVHAGAAAAAVGVSVLAVERPATLAVGLVLVLGVVALTRPTGRLIGFVGGGLLVFGGTSDVGAPKLAYLAFVAVATGIAAVRTTRLLRTPWGRPAAQLVGMSTGYVAVVLLSSVLAVAHGNTTANWLRDASGYLLLGVVPALAVDAASVLSRRTASAALAALGVVAAVGFGLDWLTRRGVSALPVGRVVLASLPLCGICFVYAVVRAFTRSRRVGWALIAVAIPACLLATGTRTAAVLMVGLVGVVGSPRRGRVAVGRAVLGAVVLVAALVAVLPWLVGVVTNQPDFLSTRLGSAAAFLAGGTDASAALRDRAYVTAEEAFASSPLLGVAPGHLFPSVHPGEGAVLNLDSPAMALAKFGLVGTAVLLAYAVAFVVAGHRTRVATGWSPEGTAARAAVILLVALLPFGAVYEDKGLAFGVVLMLVVVLAGARERISVQESVGAPEEGPDVPRTAAVRTVTVVPTTPAVPTVTVLPRAAAHLHEMVGTREDEPSTAGHDGVVTAAPIRAIPSPHRAARLAVLQLDHRGHRLAYVRALAENSGRTGPTLLFLTEEGSNSTEARVHLDQVIRSGRARVISLGPVGPPGAEMVGRALDRLDEADTLAVPEADHLLRALATSASRAHLPRLCLLVMRTPDPFAPVRRGQVRTVREVVAAGRTAAVVAAKGTLVATIRHRWKGPVRLCFLTDSWSVVTGRPGHGRLHAVPDPCPVLPAVSREDARARLSLGPGSTVLGLLGDVSTRKNPGLVLDALAGLPDDVIVLVAGRIDPPTTRRLSLVAADPSLAHRVVVRRGYLDDADLARCVIACDALVLAYDTDAPSGMLALAEHARVPVIAAGSAWVRAIVLARGAGVVTPLSADGIADGLRRLRAGVHEPSTGPSPASPLDFAHALLGTDRLPAGGD